MNAQMTWMRTRTQGWKREFEGGNGMGEKEGGKEGGNGKGVEEDTGKDEGT